MAGFWRKLGHSLFPAIIPKRSRAEQGKIDLKRGKRVKGKYAEDYAKDRAKADDDARAAAKARREARRAREQGIKGVEPKLSRKESEAYYRQRWMEQRLSRPGRRFKDNLEFFNNLPMMRGESEDTRQKLWNSYLENMVSGHQRRDSRDNPFWRDSGISIRDFDWQEYRETMGNT